MDQKEEKFLPSKFPVYRRRRRRRKEEVEVGNAMMQCACFPLSLSLPCGHVWKCQMSHGKRRRRRRRTTRRRRRIGKFAPPDFLTVQGRVGPRTLRPTGGRRRGQIRLHGPPLFQDLIVTDFSPLPPPPASSLLCEWRCDGHNCSLQQHPTNSQG